MKEHTTPAAKEGHTQMASQWLTTAESTGSERGSIIFTEHTHKTVIYLSNINNLREHRAEHVS